MASEAFIMPVLFSVLNLRPEAIGFMAVSWSAYSLPGSSGTLKPADSPQSHLGSAQASASCAAYAQNC